MTDTAPYIAQIMNRSGSLADLHITHANNATASLNSIVAGLVQSKTVTIPSITNLIDPSAPTDTNFVPNKDTAAIFRDDYQGQFQALNTWFQQLKSDATEILFPFLDTPAGDDADAWIIKAINGEAIKLAEDAELNRGRTRITEEAIRAKRTAASGYSALGYMLPTGAMLSAQLEADYGANRSIAELNRDLTIKAQEIRIDLVKTAVAQVNSLRQVAANGLTGYLNAFASLPGSAAQYAAQREQAQKDLWAAGAQYYGAQLNFQSLLTDIHKANLGKDTTMAQLDANLKDKIIERDLKSLQTAAEVYGRLVAGAMAGINSHVSLSGDARVSDSISYQYSGKV